MTLIEPATVNDPRSNNLHDALVTSSQWPALRQSIRKHWRRDDPSGLFGDPSVYRWGLAVATEGPPEKLDRELSRLAVDAAADRDIDSAWPERVDAFLQSHPGERTCVLAATRAVLWAAAMPALVDQLATEVWWELLDSLRRRREACLDDPETLAGSRLIGGGELGITLAWRLRALPSCEALMKSSLATVAEFFAGEADSIAGVLRPASHLRLVAASIARLDRMMPRAAKRKLKRRQREVTFDLASWVAALTRHDGTSAFSAATADDVIDDLPGIRHPATAKKPTKKKSAKKPSLKKQSVAPETSGAGGLLSALIPFEPESLAPAMAASLGETQSGGRLAWEVSLPESLWFDEDAGLAVMLPQWDVRRGRVFIDTTDADMRIEVMGGRCVTINGHVQTSIEINGRSLTPAGPWESTCEYTDDDVHYLEFEQPYGADGQPGGVVLQRHVMVVRDDRCVMIADAVLTKDPFDGDRESAVIRCVTRFPLDPAMRTRAEAETREIFLADRKRRAMVLPLAAGEWRVGPTDARLDVAPDHHLVLTTNGRGGMFSPLWMDFQSRRFSRKRTWRILTVAEQLDILPRGHAAAFRVQVGSEHWVVYRSLKPSSAGGFMPRSFLGKHVLADFFAARFHPGDGGMEELVTVDNTDD